MKLRIKSKKIIIRNMIVLCISIIIVIGICIIHNENNQIYKKEQSNIKGQTIVYGKDGYDNLFTWQGKVYKEFKQNKGSWAKKAYWDNTMETDGCGITAVAIIASGYSQEITPDTLRKSYYPHLEGDNIPRILERDYGIACTDFIYQESYFSEEYILEHLKENKPILVCVVNKPTTKWTTASHFLVLLAADEEGMIYVSNPNGERNTAKASNWYRKEDILPYIVKAVFVTQ